MITLKEFMELVDYKITEGSDYFVHIPGLYMLDSWNGEQNGFSFDIAFDPSDNQRVYLVEAHDYKHNRAYRLIDPALKVDALAWDGVDYTDLEVDDDFIQKCLAIKTGEDYDTQVSISIDLSESELLVYMKIAHERNITFNKLVEIALNEAITELSNKVPKENS
jgi:hypothetical protein